MSYNDLSAIDGKRKPARNFKEGSMGMGETTYTPSEEPIRSDVDELLDKPKSEFKTWYEQRKEVVLEELDKYKKIGTIPNLSFGSEKQKYDLTARSHLKEHIGTLEKGKKYLEALKDKWEERHGASID